MSHFPSSSFEWTSRTNQEYWEKNDSRFVDLFENVAARFTYPALALVAIIETVGSAVAAVFVSLSLLVPCNGWETRKAYAITFWQRSALSSLAAALDVLGFFSPWLTSKCIEHVASRLFHEKAEETGAPISEQFPPIESAQSTEEKSNDGSEEVRATESSSSESAAVKISEEDVKNPPSEAEIRKMFTDWIAPIAHQEFKQCFTVNNFQALSNQGLTDYIDTIVEMYMKSLTCTIFNKPEEKAEVEKDLHDFFAAIFPAWKAINETAFGNWLEHFDAEIKGFIAETWREIFGITRRVDISNLQEEITETSSILKQQYGAAKQNYAFSPEQCKSNLQRYSEHNKKTVKDIFGEFFWEKAHAEALAEHLDSLEQHSWYTTVKDALLSPGLQGHIFSLKAYDPTEKKETLKKTVSTLRGERTQRHFNIKAGGGEKHKKATYFLRNLPAILDMAKKYSRELMEEDSALSIEDVLGKTKEHITTFQDQVFEPAPSFLIS